MNKKIIYLDNAATTKCDSLILKKMYKFENEYWANVNSTSHELGRKALSKLLDIKVKIAKMLGCIESELIFTSSATEANHIGILGICRYQFKHFNKNEIIYSSIEHSSVISIVEKLESEGMSGIPISPKFNNNKYYFNVNDFENKINNKTAIVIAMHVNNETGLILPVKKIGEICKKNNVIYFCDCSQSIGKIHVNFRDLNISAASFTAHKIHGPKGIGFLFLNKRPRIKCEKIFYGDKLQRGFRPGTQSLSLIYGMQLALSKAINNINKNFSKLFKISDYLIKNISKIKKIKFFSNFNLLNEKYTEEFPYIHNISFYGVEGESLMFMLKDFCLSSGSACTSLNLKPSHVIQNMTNNSEWAHSNIRIGLSYKSKLSEIKKFVIKLKKSVSFLRKCSPLKIK